MIKEENVQQELDKATSSLGMIHDVELYSLLMKIKHSENREELLDQEIKLRRFILKNVWKIEEGALAGIDEDYLEKNK